MYNAFHEFLDHYGYTDDEIFDAFHELCTDLGSYVHEVLTEKIKVPKVHVEFLVASNFQPVKGYTDLRDKRGAVDQMATRITGASTLAKMGIDYSPLKFQVSRYFLSKAEVRKVLLAKVDNYTVMNWEKDKVW